MNFDGTSIELYQSIEQSVGNNLQVHFSQGAGSRECSVTAPLPLPENILG